MRLPEEPEVPAFINVTSLIDVTFSILAFFVISSLFLSQNLGLSVNLPKASSAKSQTSQRLFLSIKQDGTIALDGEKVSLEDLAEKLKQKQGKDKELVISLQADEAVSYGRVVAVIDVLRQTGGVKMALATKKVQ